MEPISIFLITSILFLAGLIIGVVLGFLIGKQELHYENLKKSLSDFKKNTIEVYNALSPRQKVVILNSKEAYLPDPDEEEQP